MIIKLFLFLLLMSSTFCQAGSLTLSFGPSIDGTIGAQKIAQLGYEIRWGAPSLTLETGMLNALGGGFVFMGGANLGVHVVSADGLSMRIGVGPAYVSQIDDRLSSHMQAHIQARVGLEMQSYQTGVQLDHWSNAGLKPPNLGLDAVSVYVGIPL